MLMTGLTKYALYDCTLVRTPVIPQYLLGPVLEKAILDAFGSGTSLESALASAANSPKLREIFQNHALDALTTRRDVYAKEISQNAEREKKRILEAKEEKVASVQEKYAPVLQEAQEVLQDVSTQLHEVSQTHSHTQRHLEVMRSELADVYGQIGGTTEADYVLWLNSQILEYDNTQSQIQPATQIPKPVSSIDDAVQNSAQNAVSSDDKEKPKSDSYTPRKKSSTPYKAKTVQDKKNNEPVQQVQPAQSLTTQNAQTGSDLETRIDAVPNIEIPTVQNSYEPIHTQTWAEKYFPKLTKYVRKWFGASDEKYSTDTKGGSQK
jgi:hypothetical protein